MDSPVFCAIDTSDMEQAESLARRLKGSVRGLKLGLEFFLRNGESGYRTMAALGMPIFLDLKLHDIPNQVAGAVASLLPLKPAFMTLHASGGRAMMQAAAKAASQAGAQRPRLLAVTVLTSLDGSDLASIGQDNAPARQVGRLAALAKECGIDGAVCSPEEVAMLRETVGPDFQLMVPGIRPSWAVANDQKRVMTPAEAMRAGASYLVIGRPITGDKDPAAAARRVQDELAA